MTKSVSTPIVRVTPDRIYCDLGDGAINFRDLDHMAEVRDTYKKVLRRGSVPGSGTFTAESMDQMRRRFNNLVEAIAEVKRLKGMK